MTTRRATAASAPLPALCRAVTLSGLIALTALVMFARSPAETSGLGPQATDEPQPRPSVTDTLPNPAGHPGCRTRLPGGVIPTHFLVVRATGQVQRMPFDDAWRRTHDTSNADDVWVIGACR